MHKSKGCCHSATHQAAVGAVVAVVAVVAAVPGHFLLALSPDQEAVATPVHLD